jgi:4'-phosphopantetheinyl transferase
VNPTSPGIDALVTTGWRPAEPAAGVGRHGPDRVLQRVAVRDGDGRRFGAVRTVVRWAVPEPVPAPDFLLPGERDRYDAFSDVDEAARFAARRWFVRSVVASVVGCEPAEVGLEQRCRRCEGPHGQPRVLTPRRRPPQASWSTAGEVVAVAVGRGPVGIDVVAEPVDLHWARTEAVLKATGHGLQVDPRAFDVEDGRVTRWDGPGRRPRVRVRDLTAGDGVAGAVATGCWFS